ncbi:hypothetical protein CRM22_007431 [Opisthorchis felineus]|uniref:Uncharacterized protein n=1 Tax=Opisthorchis felineus TaxID=147828 RepID=A0A4S2LFW2_OPIFE|nr:hypothetical protein CRM22_007431 [Opisthorchis felineus]
MDSLTELRSRDDPVISRPDKGTEMVVMNKTAYVRKMADILADTITFSQTANDKDKTLVTEQQLVMCLKRLKANGFISTTTHDKFKSTGSTTPRLYGLPKIRKSNNPLRPIPDMHTSL